MMLGAGQLLDAYRAGSLRPTGVVAALRERAAERQDAVGALTAGRWDAALDEAAAHDRAYADGRAGGPLAGVPFAVKDLFDTTDLPTTYGSPMFAAHRPASDADAVAAVRRAGGVLVAKTVTHEFAWGITSLNRRGPSCRNPRDPSRIAGGSSGGSAAAVADGIVPLAIGSDTAGSIRIPAAFCGATGFKPSFGTISTRGVWPLAPSLDHVGALATSPADAALLTDVMAGRAPGRPLRVAPSIAIAADLPAPQRDAIARAGIRMTEVALPDPAGVLAALRAIQAAEGLAVHRAAGLYPSRRAEYGADVLARLDAAAAAPAHERAAGFRHRERLTGEIAALLAAHHVLATIVSAAPPPRIADLLGAGADAANVALRDEVLSNTVLQSLLGLPACVIAVDEIDGLPVALQLCGPAAADDLVVGTAQAIFEATNDQPTPATRGAEPCARTT